MLSREDSRRLAQLERQLRQDDPEFCARMEGSKPSLLSGRRRYPILLLALAAVVWTAAVVLAVFRWWIPAGAAAFGGFAVVTFTVIRARRMPKL